MLCVGEGFGGGESNDGSRRSLRQEGTLRWFPIGCGFGCASSIPTFGGHFQVGNLFSQTGYTNGTERVYESTHVRTASQTAFRV